MANNDHTAPYAPFFKAWHVATMGKRPEVESLAIAHQLGLKPGKQALALAMFMRAEGASREQIGAACGAPQFNRTFGKAGLVAGGFMRRDMTVPRDSANRMVYRVELTARGAKAVERAIKATDAVDQPKPAKPRKAKAAKAPEAAADAPAALPAPEVAQADETSPVTA